MVRQLRYWDCCSGRRNLSRVSPLCAVEEAYHCRYVALSYPACMLDIATTTLTGHLITSTLQSSHHAHDVCSACPRVLCRAHMTGTWHELAGLSATARPLEYTDSGADLVRFPARVFAAASGFRSVSCLLKLRPCQWFTRCHTVLITQKWWNSRSSRLGHTCHAAHDFKATVDA